MSSLPLSNRNEAIKLCQKLLSEGFIQCIGSGLTTTESTTQFTDDSEVLYQFLKTQ